MEEQKKSAEIALHELERASGLTLCADEQPAGEELSGFVTATPASNNLECGEQPQAQAQSDHSAGAASAAALKTVLSAQPAAEKSRKTNNSVRFPMPQPLDSDPDLTRQINKPVFVLGSILGKILLAALVIQALAHAHGLLLIPLFRYSFFPEFTILVALALLAVRLKQVPLCEFIAGMAHPLVALLGMMKELPFSLLVDTNEGKGDYFAASQCAGQAIRIVGSIDIMQTQEFFQRDYVVDLAYAGDAGRTRYECNEWVEYARSIAASGSSATQDYHACALRNCARALELIGDRESAVALRTEAYAAYRNNDEQSVARGYALLAMGEQLYVQKDYQDAIPLFEEFMRTAPKGMLKTGSSNYKSRAIELLASSLARTNQPSASQVYEAKLRGPHGFLISAHILLEEVLLRAEILEASGRADEAAKVIEVWLRKPLASKNQILHTMATTRLQQIRQRLESVAAQGGSAKDLAKTVSGAGLAIPEMGQESNKDTEFIPPVKTLTIHPQSQFERTAGRFGALAIAMGSTAFINNPVVHGIAFSVIMMALVVFLESRRKRERMKAEALIGSETPDRATIQLKGFHSATVKTRGGTYYLELPRAAKEQKFRDFVGTEPVSGGAFFDGSELKIIELFGHHLPVSSVTKAK